MLFDWAAHCFNTSEINCRGIIIVLIGFAMQFGFGDIIWILVFPTVWQFD